MSEKAEKSLAALMFTDLVGSVSLQQRLGTAAYMRYVTRHDEIFKECLAQVDGATVLNETGDGFLVRFNDPSDAVNTALRLQRQLHGEMCLGEPIRIRIGLHLGVVTEMEEKDRKLIQLKYVEGKSYADIGKATGLSVSNVGYRLHHLLKGLAVSLRQVGVSGSQG